jgi:methylmalonyl-CoA mutase
MSSLKLLRKQCLYLSLSEYQIKVECLGAMESMYQRSQIQEESVYIMKRLKDSGELPIIGVNTYHCSHNVDEQLNTRN